MQEQLRALKEKGLTFADCVAAFGVARDTDPYAIAAANEWHKDGEIEIDDPTVVSDSSEGAYVMAWVWVDMPEKDEEDE